MQWNGLGTDRTGPARCGGLGIVNESFPKNPTNQTIWIFPAGEPSSDDEWVAPSKPGAELRLARRDAPGGFGGLGDS